MVDFKVTMQSPDGTTKGTSLEKFNSTVVELSKQMHRDPDPGPGLEGWMKDAGFEDVSVKRCPLPMGSWARDKHLVRTPSPTTTPISSPSHLPLLTLH